MWHIGEQNSGRNLIYANICLPATLKGDILEWVDLDLDYRVHMDGRIELLDEEELERNISRFGYSEGIVGDVRAACDEVLVRFESGEFPFDHARQVERYRRTSTDLATRHFDHEWHE